MLNNCELLLGRLSVIFLIVISTSSSFSTFAYTFDGSYKISPKPCTIDTRIGTCMFVWECLKTEGKHLGMCVDGFMFGSCCGHNTSSNLVLDHNSITTTIKTTSTTNFPEETAIFSTNKITTTTSTSTTTESPPRRTTTKKSWTTTWRPTASALFASSTSSSSSSSSSSPSAATSSSTISELQLPFVTVNGSSLPEEYTILSSSTLSSSPSSSSSLSHSGGGGNNFKPSGSGSSSSSSTSANINSSFSPYSSLTSTTVSSSSSSTAASTTSKPTLSMTTTTTVHPTTTNANTHHNNNHHHHQHHIFKTTQRPTTIFIDPMSTTTPQPNISLDRNYGCGVSPIYPQMRIVGGKDASFAGFPWQVSVRRTSFFGFSSTHRCGGALLNENWIATAGHCVDDLLTSQIRIRLGEWDFGSTSEKYPHVERSVTKKVVHPSYNFFTYENDLALIKLETPVILTPHINPICLPGNDDLLINENATVSGWGRLSEGGSLPSILQHVTVPILSNAKCRDMFLKSGRVEHIPDIFLCAGYEHGGRDSCQGDSGGPLAVRSRVDNRWFLAGIISWGIGCGESNMPGVCTRVSAFRDFILKHVKT